MASDLASRWILPAGLANRHPPKRMRSGPPSSGAAYLPEYHNPQLEQAVHLNEEAAATEEEGTHARETAERYIGATVLFALVLFLVAVSQRFRVQGVRMGAVATLPRL